MPYFDFSLSFETPFPIGSEFFLYCVMILTIVSFFIPTRTLVKVLFPHVWSIVITFEQLCLLHIFSFKHHPKTAV